MHTENNFFHKFFQKVYKNDGSKAITYIGVTNMSYIKPFEELEFYDDFMFGLVMQNKELCRKVLECLMGIKIKQISFPEPQKAFEPFYSSHLYSKV